jgi:hypothetical protein
VGYSSRQDQEIVWMAFFQRFRVTSLFCLAWALLIYCDVPLHAANQAGKHGWFQAAITGAYEGEVSGNGLLVLLPEAGFEKQGYFFLADGQGLRPHGVTFILPRGITPGRFPLKSLSPLDIGKFPSVRVDRDMGDSVLSAEKNTSGFLELDAFPVAESDLSGSDLRGSFEFETEHLNGELITVRGNFSFKAQ